jgi:hypothetical protein
VPNWLLAAICLVALIGFIGYAFYQGTKVRPDRNNSNFGPGHAGQGVNDGQIDGTHGGSDGHSGF